MCRRNQRIQASFISWVTMKFCTYAEKIKKERECWQKINATDDLKT